MKKVRRQNQKNKDENVKIMVYWSFSDNPGRGQIKLRE
jgi:hypothetical protein